MYFDINELKTHIPKSLNKHITEDFVQTLNKMVDSPEFGENFSRNLIMYTSVLSTGKYRLVDYFNAIAYVSHKALGCSNATAYAKVYPDRYKRLQSKYGSDVKQISSAIAAYGRSKLVISLQDLMLVPDYLMFSSVRHTAIRTLATLMSSSNENVAHKAANSILNHLKPPQKNQLELSIPAMDKGVMTDLADALTKLSQSQGQAIIEGSLDASYVAEKPLQINK